MTDAGDEPNIDVAAIAASVNQIVSARQMSPNTKRQIASSVMKFGLDHKEKQYVPLSDMLKLFSGYRDLPTYFSGVMDLHGDVDLDHDNRKILGENIAVFLYPDIHNTSRVKPKVPLPLPVIDEGSIDNIVYEIEKAHMTGYSYHKKEFIAGLRESKLLASPEQNYTVLEYLSLSGEEPTYLHLPEHNVRYLGKEWAAKFSRSIKWLKIKWSEERKGSRATPFHSILAEINKYPLISGDEESFLMKKAMHNDEYAITKVLRSHQRYVLKVARSYQPCSVPLGDLFLAGMESLSKAIPSFDYRNNNGLLAFAGKGIIWSMGSLIKEYNEHQRRISLYSSVGVSKPLIETLENDESPPPDATIVTETLLNEINRALHRLTPDQRLVMEHRYALNGKERLGYMEIGGILGKSHNQPYLLEQQAKKKLKIYLKNVV